MRKLFSRTLLSLLGIAAASSMGSLGFAEEVRTKLHLIAIGVSDYQHDVAKKDGELALGDLKFADRDAREIVEVIRSSGSGDTKLTLLADGSAPDMLPTHNNVQRVLKDVMKTPAETLVVMFFGHGVDLSGSSYLCLSDCKIGRKNGETYYSISNALSVQQLSDILASANAKTKVIVTDACRNLNEIDSNVDVSEVANYDIGRHLKELGKDQQVGQHFIISSCLPNQVALEPDNLGHGLFANFLIEGLQGASDFNGGNRDGKIGLHELFLYAARETYAYGFKKLGRKQRPFIQGAMADEIIVSEMNDTIIEKMKQKYVSIRFDTASYSHEQQMAEEEYGLALEAFGLLEIDNCIVLLDRVLRVMPNHTEAMRLRALCYTLNGQEMQAIEDLKKLTRTLKAKVFTSNSDLLGVRDPKNTGLKLVGLSFEQGDVLDVKDYSPEGRNGAGKAIPAGKYLYVNRLKRKGSNEWIPAEGVVFADVIKPTSIEQVVERIQASQREFGNTRVQTSGEILEKTSVRGVGLASNATPAQRAEAAIVATQKGLSLYSNIRSGNTTGIVMDGIGIVAPNAAPKVQRAYNAYSTVRGMIGF